MIKLKNITKIYDGKAVLDDFRFEFGARAYCITGPSGCGKTTLLHTVLGLVKPDAGEVIFSGNDGGETTVTGPRPRFGAVFQDDRLCENISAVKNAALVCPARFPKEEIIRQLKLSGLADSLYKPAAVLSGGMKRRVAIVRALITDADIIIMDEPLKGLDDELKTGIVNYINEKVKDKTFIFVTHDKSEAKLFDAELLSFTSRELIPNKN